MHCFYVKSTSMNYPIHQFSKHLHYYLTNYDQCSICATSANSGTWAGIAINKWKLLEDDLKRCISVQSYDSDFVKQISDYIICHLCHYW